MEMVPDMLRLWVDVSARVKVGDGDRVRVWENDRVGGWLGDGEGEGERVGVGRGVAEGVRDWEGVGVRVEGPAWEAEWVWVCEKVLENVWVDTGAPCNYVIIT